MNLKRHQELLQGIYEQKESQHYYAAKQKREKESKRLKELVNKVLLPILEEETAVFDMWEFSTSSRDLRNEAIDEALRMCFIYVKEAVISCGQFSNNPQKSSDLFASEFDEES